MNRWILLCALLSFSLLATIKYDFIQKRYYPFPEDKHVDIELYNHYMCMVNIYALELMNADVPIDDRSDYIEIYLASRENYTASRLLSDLRESSSVKKPVIQSKQVNRDA